MLIKPFLATVNASGFGVTIVNHGLHGIVWKVYQLGIGLGQVNLQAQVAAHVNGIPLAATVAMQQSVFSAIGQFNPFMQAPYAMESFFVGPPYIILSAGDQLAVGVLNANPGDTLTVGAYLEEFNANEYVTMGA